MKKADSGFSIDDPIVMNRSTSVRPRSLRDVQQDLTQFLLALNTFNDSDSSKFLAENPREVLRQVHELIAMIKVTGIEINGIIVEVVEDPQDQPKKLYDLFFGGFLRIFLDYVSAVCTILLLLDKVNQEFDAPGCSENNKVMCKGLISKIAKRPGELISAFEGILTTPTKINGSNSDQEFWMLKQVTQRMMIFKDIVHSLVKLTESKTEKQEQRIVDFKKEYRRENAKQVALDLITYVNEFGSEDYHVVHLQSYLFAEFLGVINREVPYVSATEMFPAPLPENNNNSNIDYEQQQLDNFRRQLTTTETIQNSLQEAQGELTVIESPVFARMPNLQHNRDDVQAQINLLMERQQQLAAFVLSREMRLQTAQDQFKGRLNCLLFYRILNIRLEEYFQGLKVIASGFVGHEILDAKGVAAKGLEVAEKVVHGVPLVGGILALFFGIGSEVTEIASHKSMINRAKHISELGTIADFITAAENTARKMTLLLAPILDSMLNEEETELYQGNVLRRVMSGIFQGVLNSHGKASAQWVAEFCALKVLDSLMNEHTIHHDVALTPQFVRVISDCNYRFQSVHACAKWGLSGFAKRGLFVWSGERTEVKRVEFSHVLSQIKANDLPALPAPKLLHSSRERNNSQQLAIIAPPSPPPAQVEDPRIGVMQQQINTLQDTVGMLQMQMAEMMEEMRRLRRAVDGTDYNSDQPSLK